MDIYDIMGIIDIIGFYDIMDYIYIYDILHIVGFLDSLETFFARYSYFPVRATCSGPGFSGSFQTPSKRPNTQLDQMCFC